jgi:hypothetical protein
VRTLNSALAIPLYPLPDNVLNVIQTYLNRYLETDAQESTRLHEELLNIHALRVQGNPDKLAVFLACFRALGPEIFGVEELLKWWEILVKPTFDSMGQVSSVFTDKLFEIFLEKTKLPVSSDTGPVIHEEQNHRFVSANVEAVLLAYGKRKPKVRQVPTDGDYLRVLIRWPDRLSSKGWTLSLSRRSLDFKH